MSIIHYPPAFAQDPIVSGPLLPPTNAAQMQTYNAAKEARGTYGVFPSKYLAPVAFMLHVGHNLKVAKRRFVPLSVIDSPADLQKPYGVWSGYEWLVLINPDLTVGWKYFKYDTDPRFREAGLREALCAFRRYRSEATDTNDVAGLDAAIHEAIDQIDRSRSVQRKRRETA